MIAEVKDEACTQWASEWLAFQCRASRAFPDLEFNIQLSDEEVEGSASEAEVKVGTEVFSGNPDRAPLPSDSQVPPEASSSSSPAGAPLFYSSASTSRGPNDRRLGSFFSFFGVSWRGAWVFILLLFLTIY